MIQRISGKPNIQFFPKTASTAYVANSVVYSDGSGGLTTDTTVSSYPSAFVPLGVMMTTVSSTDPDYTSTKKVAVDVPLPTDVFDADVSAGTPTANMVGKLYNFNTAKTAVDLSVDVPDGDVRVVSLSSGGRVAVSFIPHIDFRGSRNLLLSNKYWNIETKRQSGASISTASVGATNKDFQVIGTAEQQWEAVRLHILNAETSNSTQAVKASFTPSANMTSLSTPTGTATIFTWSGAGTVDLVNSSSSALFNVVSSDWMDGANIKPIARDDGGSYPLFYLRIHLPTGAGSYTYSTEGSSGLTYDTDALTSGRRWFKSFQSNIDSIGTPAAYTQTGASNLFPTMILQFRSRGNVISFMCAGDSIMGGSLTTGNMLSPGFRASVATSTPGLPVQFVNSGWSSQTSVNYLANAKKFIDTVKPQVCAYSVFSPNDSTISEAVIATQMSQAMDFVAYCRENDVVPILCTPTPNNTDSLTVSNFKITLTNTLLGLRSRGILVADFWTSVAAFPGQNKSTGWGWIQGYHGDDLHPSDAGSAVMSATLSDILRAIIRANS